MKQQLMEDLKKAMKDGNVIKKNTIQMIRAAILQEEKDKQISLTNTQIEDVIMREKKKRLDALAQYENCNRPDLIEQTNKELCYICMYLPEPANEVEIAQYIQQVITEMNATGKDMGLVIRKGKEYFGNRADGKLLSSIVKKELSI